jgi:hypothetical protein
LFPETPNLALEPETRFAVSGRLAGRAHAAIRPSGAGIREFAVSA